MSIAKALAGSGHRKAMKRHAKKKAKKKKAKKKTAKKRTKKTAKRRSKKSGRKAGSKARKSLARKRGRRSGMRILKATGVKSRKSVKMGKKTKRRFSTKVQVGRAKVKASCPAGMVLITGSGTKKVRRPGKKAKKFTVVWGRCVTS